MHYKDTSVSQLKLNALFRPVHCSAALDEIKTVYREYQDIFDNRLRLKCSIIGASHLISLVDADSDTVVFEEILANYDATEACGNSSLDGVKTLSYEAIDSSAVGWNVQDIAYEFIGRTVTLKELLEASEFRSEFQGSETHSGDRFEADTMVLRHTFSSGDTASDVKPVTIVKVICLKHEVIVKSCHVYPNEDRAFISRSSIRTTCTFSKPQIILADRRQLVEAMVKAFGCEVSEAEQIVNRSLVKRDPLADWIASLPDELNAQMRQVSDAFKETVQREHLDNAFEQMQKGMSDLVDRLRSKDGHEH